MRPALLVLLALCLIMASSVHADDPAITASMDIFITTSTSPLASTSTSATITGTPIHNQHSTLPLLPSRVTNITPLPSLNSTNTTTTSTPDNLGTFTTCCPNYLSLITLCLSSLSMTLPANTTLAAAVGPMYTCACAQGSQFVSAFLVCYDCLSGAQSSGLTVAAIQNACNIIENGQVLPGGFGLALESGRISNLTAVLPQTSGTLTVQIWPGHTPIPAAAARSGVVAWKGIMLGVAVGLLGMYACGW